MSDTSWDAEGTVGRIVQSFHNGSLREIFTYSSTATSVIVMAPQIVPPSGHSSIAIICRSDEELRSELTEYARQGYRFSLSDVTVTVSVYQNRLRDARAALLEIIRSGRRSVYALQTVVNNTGEALNLQVDKDPRVFGVASVSDNIHAKLKHIGLADEDLPLFDKYKHLNRFYNATKHANRPVHAETAERLNSTDGILIAMDYHETVRRVFCWYYRSTTGVVPPWTELEPIAEYPSGMPYVFDITQYWG